ncbi:ABC transporter ATP-binding protein [Actinomarinicola tropica]|uniref:ATP-binding cassette domain-containing protein n=1 Tax=Actinomarinicola tropica TaxID=2789776 RepID=A0A5Q2RSB6_9ACTN|nr:ABC transporter ATP-binding protein [Actinomarinicola tropica]QGG97067.1 ATP-binding cassette domain-containing protein [Actinomarinicola tropica]
MMGAGGGGAFAAARGGAAQSGLPFAGIPPELQKKVDDLLATEPDTPAPTVEFSHSRYDRRRLRLRTLLAPHALALVGAFGLVLLETLALQAGPVLTQIGIDHGIRAGDKGVLVVVAAIYLVSIVANVYAARARVAWSGRVGERLMYALRVRVFSHLQRLDVGYFTGEKAGRLMSRMTSDIESLTQLFHEGLIQMVVQALTLIVVVVALFTYDVQLAMVTLFVIVPFMLVMTVWFRSASDRGYVVVRDRIADVLAHLQESLSGVRIVAAHNRQRQNVAEHRNEAGSYREANDYTAKVGAAYSAGTEVVGIAGQAIILLVGGRMVLDGELTVGQLTAFVLFLSTFFAPIQQLVNLYNTYQKGQASMSKLADLLATEPLTAERDGAVELPPVDGEISFEDVEFAYVPGTPVLTDLDLTIRAGEVFALVGATGAGKSTIANLVTRFYDPTRGTVRIDGHDLRDVTLSSLRRQLGIVPQEPFLFGGSIRDNIAFARPDATDEEVAEACAAVGIDDLVARLPQGVDTPCHERGVSLSSGERQLLALARAFLARPRVLVLDEATSNLDLRSEAKIERALDTLLEGRTAIIIAHRLATAMRADRIAVVDGGRIVELGSHDELVALGGEYADMYATWERHAAGERTAEV